MNKLFILCLIAIVACQVSTKRRRVQAVQQPAPAASTSGSASGSSSGSTSGAASGGAHGTVRIHVNAPSTGSASTGSTTSAAAQSAQAAADRAQAATQAAGRAAANPADHPFFSKHPWARWVFGILYLVVGLPLCVMGLAWWKYNCFPFAGMIGFIGALTIVTLFVDGDTSEGWLWGGLAISLAVSAGLVVIFFFCKHITGGILGFSVGWIAYCFFAVNYRIITGENPGWWHFIIMASMVAGGIVFGCCWNKDITIIATALSGGWYMVTGVGMMTDQFPYPPHGVESWVTWCYIIAAIALSVGGFFFQCVHKSRRDKAEGGELVENGQVTITVDAELRV